MLSKGDGGWKDFIKYSKEINHLCTKCERRGRETIRTNEQMNDNHKKLREGQNSRSKYRGWSKLEAISQLKQGYGDADRQGLVRDLVMG